MNLVNICRTEGVLYMGKYLNAGNEAFSEAVSSEIYVDKTGLIKQTNHVLGTKQKYVCVSRPRRFGKSITADMLTAYYSTGCCSAELFAPFRIASEESFGKHLNRYNVLHLNMTEFISRADDMKGVLDYLSRRVLREFQKEFCDVDCFDWNDLLAVITDVYEEKKIPFVFIIDEWDCVFRIKRFTQEDQMIYLDFLRNLLKDQNYVALAYMTGILPIKKYGEHSALNMFTEISMLYAEPYSKFTGFTESEVQNLCLLYHKDFDEMKRWYDGYCVDDVSVCNPRSVVESITRGKMMNYWNATETYKALQDYIKLNFDGLREKIIRMIAGERVPVNPAKFQNDMTSFQSADDVLTLLIHLGYLTYDSSTGITWIPNSEVQQEFINSIEDGGWEEIMHAVRASDELMQATLNGDADTVAEMIARSHEENASILKYNDENSLACVISLAYYTARKNYIMHRELPTGKGFADIVYIPRKNVDAPALVIELKYQQPAETAITQIREKRYPAKIAEYTGEILLVGISYDDDKGHRCVIERFQK